MSNHSLIPLPTPVTPDDVERAVEKINQRRFRGRLRIYSPPEVTESWGAERAWLVDAPNTCPKDRHPSEPDEDLGFCFWLRKGGMIIETRHNVYNSWMRWVMYIHEHELARHFGVEKFDSGCGVEDVDPDQYKDSFGAWVMRNCAEPVDEKTKEYIKNRYLVDVPEGWT